MKIFRKTALTLLMAIVMGTSSTLVFAEATANSSAASISATIEHVQKAIVEVKNSDFSAANLHLKAARASAEQITGNEAVVKQANSNIIQGQIESKKGDIAKSSELLIKGLELYKSL